MKKKDIKEFKVVMLGVSGVGKTSIIERFTKNVFNSAQAATYGLSYLKHTFSVENTSIKLNIWDTAGQERFHSLVSMYYRNSHAAVVVYDIQNHDSFQRAKCWVTTLKNQNPPTNVIALTANKCEPLKCHSAVSLNEVMNYAKENGLIFMETSAKTALNVQELFIMIGEALINDVNSDDQDRPNYGATGQISAEFGENRESKSGKCC